jgi:hypothetical protein
MAVVRITLPDDLARELADSGLLEPRSIESILREQLRAARVRDLVAFRAAHLDDPVEPMTNDEINAEIEAYRAEQRRAAGP